MSTILTRSDYLKYLQYLTSENNFSDEKYLIEKYFGKGQNYLDLLINRAYRDLCRTMHGFRNIPEKNEARRVASDQLKMSLFKIIKGKETIDNQIEFNLWHQNLCMTLIESFYNYHFHFYYGQAQKWINMSFKYIYTLGDKFFPDSMDYYQFCHVPLDNILTTQLRNYGFPGLKTKWSRLEDYEDYLDSQLWVRENFSLCPLDVEFCLWLGIKKDAIENSSIK